MRLHVAAWDVTPSEIEVLAAWVEGRPGSNDAARQIFDRRAARIARWSRSAEEDKDESADARAHGHHDLHAILHQLKARYFPGLAPVYVAWSGRLGDNRRSRLGWWNPADRVVRIHRCLDDPRVPRFFVASVVHHELCHAALDPSLTPTGKRRLHGRDFRILERKFPDLGKALEWERRELPGVLFD
jgi:hypothetical protein